LQINIWINSNKLPTIIFTDLLLYLIGLLISTYIGSKLVEYVLSKLDLPEEEGFRRGIKGAGKVIGIIERILVTILIYMNQPTAIAIIFMAKSIMRFEQSKEREFAEYYLIGTLTSITFALITGVIFNQLINLANFIITH